MYSDLKRRILPLLYDITSPTGVEVIKILDEYEHRMKGAIEWSAADVLDRATWEMSEDQAQEILEEIIDNHDCNLGITWETIDGYVDKYKPL